MSKLVALGGHSVVLGEEPLLVGTAPTNGLPVQDGLGVVPTHYQIVWENDYHFIEPATDRALTYVNGDELTERRLLKDGDVIRAGQLELTFLATLSCPSRVRELRKPLDIDALITQRPKKRIRKKVSFRSAAALGTVALLSVVGILALNAQTLLRWIESARLPSTEVLIEVSPEMKKARESQPMADSKAPNNASDLKPEPLTDPRELNGIWVSAQTIEGEGFEAIASSPFAQTGVVFLFDGLLGEYRLYAPGKREDGKMLTATERAALMSSGESRPFEILPGSRLKLHNTSQESMLFSVARFGERGLSMVWKNPDSTQPALRRLCLRSESLHAGPLAVTPVGESEE